LGVYHRAYWQRQVTALLATFEATSRRVGQQHFERLLLQYLEACPGEEPCIEQLGARCVEFLATRQGLDAEALGVARLEWAHSKSLLAKDPTEVARLPLGMGAAFAECRLTFVPSLHVEHVPAASLRWLAGDAQRLPELMEQSDAINVAFWRPEHAVLRSALATDEARAHLLARGGATIAVICTAFEALPEAAAASRALQVLSRWFARGWVERVET